MIYRPQRLIIIPQISAWVQALFTILKCKKLSWYTKEEGVNVILHLAAKYLISLLLTNQHISKSDKEATVVVLWKFGNHYSVCYIQYFKCNLTIFQLKAMRQTLQGLSKLNILSNRHHQIVYNSLNSRSKESKY